MNGQAIETISVLDLTERSERETTDSKRIIKSNVFEKRRFPYLHLLPAMWLLIGYVLAKKALWKLIFGSRPKINSIFFDGLGLYSRKVKGGLMEGAGCYLQSPFRANNQSQHMDR